MIWWMILLAVNLAGFLSVWLGSRLGAGTDSRGLRIFWVILSLLGRSVGAASALLIFNRRTNKTNMMFWVFEICLWIVQMVVLLYALGFHRPAFVWNPIPFFAGKRWFLVWLAFINLLTFAMFGVDKFCAVRQKSRIRITTLLALSFCGGSVGGILGMILFRHKIRKSYFAVGLPLILCTQAIVMLYAANFAWQSI